MSFFEFVRIVKRNLRYACAVRRTIKGIRVSLSAKRFGQI